MLSLDSILIVFVLLSGFYMAWNIGANDVSNAMGTSVGSGALTLLKAVIIAGILEFAGAFLLGGHVSKTIQQGIVDPSAFAMRPNWLLFGMLATLLATASWLQIASFFGWPVSTTHAIIGALLGVGWVAGGTSAIQWSEVGQIAASWVISPAMSALFSFLIFSFLQRKILFSPHPIAAARRLIPFLTGIVVVTFLLSAFLNGLGALPIKLSTNTLLFISLGGGVVSALIASRLVLKVKAPAHLFSLTPPNIARQAFSLEKALKHLRRVHLSSKGDKREDIGNIVHRIESYTAEMKEKSSQYISSSNYQIIEKMFAALQILSASYVAFAHGANDVANAIGPVAGALDIIRHGGLTLSYHIPLWLLALGGIGIVIGLATWGWRVMETIGKKITALTPTRGFCAEFGAAVTILIASRLGLPISTTHCIVGAVLGVGIARGISALNLRTLRDIVLSWVITLPCSALASIIIFSLLRAFFS